MNATMTTTTASHDLAAIMRRSVAKPAAGSIVVAVPTGRPKLRLANQSRNPMKSPAAAPAMELLQVSRAPDLVEEIALAVVAVAALVGVVAGLAAAFNFTVHGAEFAALVQRFIA
jgi:hypothetical protein